MAQSFGACVLEVLAAPEFILQACISACVAITLYVVIAGTMAWRFPRVVERHVFAWSLGADFSLGLVSLIFGSPVLAAFSVAHNKWGIMKTYNNISDVSDGTGGWAWWALSMPLYLLLWDATFYGLHLWSVVLVYPTRTS